MQQAEFIRFKGDISNIAVPEKFTNPFDYEPCELSRIAVAELQQCLSNKNTKGKMFGVLVVKSLDGELGYLAAISGKNDIVLPVVLVPPVFDLYNEESFYTKGEAELTALNNNIAELENSNRYTEGLQRVIRIQFEANTKINNFKKHIREAKLKRKELRTEAIKTMSNESFLQFDNELTKESMWQKAELTRLKSYWKQKVLEVQSNYYEQIKYINELKSERARKSAFLQKKLFESYSFFNALGEQRNLIDIFSKTDQKVPPSAAGDCAAPKLLQFAYKYNYIPVAMAEFWWGLPPVSEIRRHGHYYPACRLKCQPILGHMLKGITIYNNEKPAIDNKKITIEIVYDDEYIAVINKPVGLLSVPGKIDNESVYSLMKNIYPKATEPLIVHRLDMATSGLMIIAKTKDVHEHLQKQFLNNTIQKRYVAIVNGYIANNEGVIELPLRVDLNDRPRQVVCYEYGKPAKTIWRVVERYEDKTKVHFFPVTGRTHQLRVHSAHHLGLNTPIVGDELYGTKATRLCLHAETIKFTHPVWNKNISFKVEAEF